MEQGVMQLIREMIYIQKLVVDGSVSFHMFNEFVWAEA